MARRRVVIWLAAVLVLSVMAISCSHSVTPTEDTATPTTPAGTVVTSAADHPPTLEPIGDKTISQGSTLRFAISANDPDGDTLVFSASGLPPEAVFDASTRTFFWVPESPGTFGDISFTVSDGQFTASQSITITVRRVVPGPIADPPEGIAPLAVFFYGNHTPEIDSLISAVRPQYAIVNPPHGLWGEISSHNSFHNMGQYRAAGIKVIGYITAGYEGAGSNGNIDPKWYTLDMNQSLIKNMAEIDHVDGVFIDECSAFPSPSAKSYLKTLTDLAHSYGLITWGNVGQAEFDSWFFTGGGFDLMHSNENWSGQTLSSVQRDWGYRISVSGEQPTYTAQDAFNLTIKAWEAGLAYCYITDFGYVSIPSWFDEYADLLQAYRSTTSGASPPPGNLPP